uniref:Complex 1 LYR protein domain-containing protein n=1 Tax=Trypanosoma congolense (strain IL3000) TaxID=1068625 RepID=G0UXX4_TRYCI|nr:conserved hypothetical protein [Trypanosoma congolense IL3000]
MADRIAHSMTQLRAKMLSAARKFPDYNFRHYFVRHVKDEFKGMKEWSVEEKQRFLREQGTKKLNEMRRMALVNRMYTSNLVFLDEKEIRKGSAATSRSADQDK